MNKLYAHIILLIVAAVANTALASVEVSFKEGAPKDRFLISNSGDCTLENLQLEIDLTKSAGALIFDTAEQGDGVEVFQPFETNDMGLTLLGATTVLDGQKMVSLAIESLSPNETLSFTIDVDDTLTNSELGNIRVSKSEIQGSTVEVETPDGELSANKTLSAIFGDDAKAIVLMPECSN